MRFIQTRLMAGPARSPLSRRYGRSDRLGRRWPATAAAVATVLLAAGCGIGGGGSSGVTHVNASLTVAVFPGVDTAPLYIAQHDGDLAAAGLHVTINQVSSVSAALAALQSGKANVAAGDYVDFFYAQSKARHPDLRIVADAYDCAAGVMQVLTLPNSGITKPQQLETKIVGTPEPQGIPVVTSKQQGTAPYSQEMLLTRSALDSQNVNSAKITWLPMPASGLVPALRSHTVNAILVQEPYIFQAESTLGAVPVLDSCTGATASLPLDGYFTTSSFAASNTPALDAFRSVVQQEQAAATQQMTVRQQLAALPNMTQQAAALVTLGAYPPTLSAARIQRIADLMLTYLVLGSGLTAQDMIVP